jgi:hypothetical protein
VIGRAFLFGFLASTTVLAQEKPGEEPAERAPTYDRVQGMLEAGLGWLVLPGAEVCVEPTIAGCSRGDSSLQLDAWQLFRLNRRFAAGAGVVLGLTPTTDAPREDPPGVTRDHTRRYFSVEATARYYYLTGVSLEGWVGLTGGLVVVSDRFESTEGNSDKALVGPRGITYLLSPNWTLGGTLRYGSWFLPKEPETDPFGDEASLRGQNNVLSLSMILGFRAPI